MSSSLQPISGPPACPRRSVDNGDRPPAKQEGSHEAVRGAWRGCHFGRYKHPAILAGAALETFHCRQPGIRVDLCSESLNYVTRRWEGGRLEQGHGRRTGGWRIRPPLSHSDHIRLGIDSSSSCICET
ncbi:Hypp2500 [Branchiostoma lanceolatum]|uniref:Hypp2500 protein n=1 Tax=Branchiostoma lanceolatum TaxID=7740 RepID=A0A8J9ZTX8_BRALA|nr:Hypp2500 [Branchiostoma lanceolatum]